MSKKKILLAAIILICGVLLNAAIILYHNDVPDSNRMVSVELTLKSDQANQFQLFYLTDHQKMPQDFNEAQSSKVAYGNINGVETLSFAVPGNAKYIRFDFGSTVANTTIQNMTLRYKIIKDHLTTKQVLNVVKEKQVEVKKHGSTILVTATKNDPYMVWSTKDLSMSQLWTGAYPILFWTVKIFALIIIDAMFFVVFKKFNALVALPKELIQNRKLIFNLAKSDFKTRFAGSFFGIVWAFVQPIVTVLVYWFVFEKGLHSSGVNTRAGINVPFVLWLIAGMVPWFFFSEALNGGTNAMMEYSYLVKKVVFKISILPIVKVFSALFVHLFFIFFTLALYTGYRYYPDLYTLQIIYYSFAMLVFVLALVYGTCSIVIFFRDLSQIINIVLQIGVWITPIMWNIDTMQLSPILIGIFKANPLYYIVAGYRDALINKVWFWQHPGLTLYFWTVTLLLLGIGGSIFKRLKVHFADVL